MADLQLILNDIAYSPVEMIADSPLTPVLLMVVIALSVLLIRFLFARKNS